MIKTLLLITIYINRLLNNKDKVLQFIEYITQISNEILKLEKNVSGYLGVNTLEPYMYLTLEKLYLYISNHTIIKNWFYLFEKNYNELYLLGNKVSAILDEIDLLQKELNKYLLKTEYLNYQYTDEASKSLSFRRYSKKYFNKKEINLAHVSLDNLLTLYERYYRKQLELNHLIVDMSQTKKVSVVKD